ncbi:generating NADPH oxidase heavy chain subunit [Seminavis robusta]|uniref:Generating NADPH oxidase heavy chain subunit n=1 Tax=Seminavis robusta TaxID=568900 RepID=A0A9N8HVZ7_9STRA|nr:generating NADPH oxidase heavy chain subunit [Seminavis robusta]|eukprot:Sro1572_g283390.1 generating NADPH oxidase heavy chain subunit (858) ;mRNA; r:7517-10187
MMKSSSSSLGTSSCRFARTLQGFRGDLDDTTEHEVDGYDQEALDHFWKHLTSVDVDDYAEYLHKVSQQQPSRDESVRSLLSQYWWDSRKGLSTSVQSLLSSMGEFVGSEHDDEDMMAPLAMEEARDAAIDAIFDRLDLDGDGLLDRQDLQALLMDAATKINLTIEPAVIDAAIDALIEDAGSDEAMFSMEESYTIGDYNSRRGNSSLACLDPLDSINKAQFSNIFKRHPDMLTVFQDPADQQHGAALSDKKALRPLGDTDLKTEHEENEQVWQTRWKNWNVNMFWLALYVAANAIAFTTKAVKYANHDEAQAVFGQCIVAARGAAQCLNLNCALILLPMCRHFLTRLRGTSARFYFPFDSALDVHKLLGAAILWWTLVHVGAHLCDFHRLAHADEDALFELVGDKLGDHIPSSPAGRWNLALFHTRAGVTGIIMVLCMIIAYPLIHFRRQHFNAFWTSHHLLLVMLIALCIHGTGGLLENYQSVFWLMIPLALYFTPRFVRETPLSRTGVISAKIKNGDVLCLRLGKPRHWDSVLQSGMYAFIHVPAISQFEWHPFTLTSSSNDPFIEFHIRSAGDWTGKLHEYIKSLNSRSGNNGTACELGASCSASHSMSFSDESTTTRIEDSLHAQQSDEECATNWVSDEEGQLMASKKHTHRSVRQSRAIRDIVVKVEGPIGASSQGFKDFPIIVLVGAGIGVTPLISVLKDLLHNPGNMQRVFFYWTVRDRAAFEWFSGIMDKVYKSDQKHVLQVRHFLTSVKDDNRDVGAVLLHHATRAKHQTDGFDLLLGQQTHHQVEVGRPTWKDELQSVKREAKALGHNSCGIFLCGPERMAQSIADVSRSLSRKDPDFHYYFNKETF